MAGGVVILLMKVASMVQGLVFVPVRKVVLVTV